jgi:hypothetical protein
MTLNILPAITFLSLVTSVKDYVEIVHKLIESDSSFKINNYEELGPIITYILISLKSFIFNVISLNWLNQIWDLPIIIPDISSAMISEVSILDGYFHNAFNFLDKPLSYGETNIWFSSLEKFTIGLINSFFLFIPTGAAQLITIRRFVMQGLDAGYLAGLGSIFGNLLWITSIIFGCRFFVIPWLSLDIFRYLLGFVLLVKYMWDSYNERKTVIMTEPAKQKIFLLNFLLALTEQTSIYPYLTNLSIGTESSILESFPAQDFSSFLSIHTCYILGLTLGSLSLLHFTCWFWENPAFKIYMWLISSFKVSTSFYYKVLNLTFLYLTMICAISSIPYYGLDYTLTNPLGLVQDDRMLYQSETLSKAPQFSFLGTKASDRNTRRNRGRHGRRERWKRRIRKYRTFDASLYDQGVYDLFSIEDLNYGFDRFWLRRKMRNHRVRFRLFPGSWMRSFKKQLAKPRLESYAGPRQEFFRVLFEQVYHPSFHVYSTPIKLELAQKKDIFSGPVSSNFDKNVWASVLNPNSRAGSIYLGQGESSIYFNDVASANNLQNRNNSIIKENLKVENSTLRKFVRKMDTRFKTAEIKANLKKPYTELTPVLSLSRFSSTYSNGLGSSENRIYSKRWKQIFSRLAHQNSHGEDLNTNKGVFNNFYRNSLSFNSAGPYQQKGDLLKQKSQINFSKQEQQILNYRSIYLNKKTDNLNIKSSSKNRNLKSSNTPFYMFHPLKFYQKNQRAFEKKLHYYTPTIFRKFSIENNAPYFRVMMKRYFYYYKPTLRWERTMKIASLRKARRKTPANPRKIQFSDGLATQLKNQYSLSMNENQKTENLALSENFTNSNLTNFSRKSIPTHNYTIVGKRASRYRYQIYKDVLQHWYYTPFNRLLLKFDIDLFMNRQPNAHFLTKNEENLLHLRRFLLSEHYNTLRWYTQMEHYRSMKTKIGGTKSFASGIYNQQFSGTFKKIRHLFAITPSQNNEGGASHQPTILKFDQPLYNEIFQNSNQNYQKNLLIHEELLNNAVNLRTSDLNNERKNQSIGLGQDLVEQSTSILGDYLKTTNPIKQNYIKKLLNEKNYLELTHFLYKGKKTRGLKPVTNSSDFLNQEKDYLLTNLESKNLKEIDKLNLDNYLRTSKENGPNDLWMNLLKKWKRKINDQEFLKNYLQRRVEKREKRKQKKEKNIKIKLKRLENNLGSFDPFFRASDSNDGVPQASTNRENPLTSSDSSLFNNAAPQNSLTTGLQKALNDGMRYGLKTTEHGFSNTTSSFVGDSSTNSFKQAATTSVQNLKDQSFKKRESELNGSLNQLLKVLDKSKQNINSFKTESSVGVASFTKNSGDSNLLSIKSLNLKHLSSQMFSFIPSKLKDIYSQYKLKSRKFLKTKVLKIFTHSTDRKKNFKNWQEKERTLNKQKRMRKEFKPLSKKPFNTNVKDYSKYVDETSDIPLRGKTLSKFKSNLDINVSNLNLDNSQLLPLGKTLFSFENPGMNKNPISLYQNPTRKKLDGENLNTNDPKRNEFTTESLKEKAVGLNTPFNGQFKKLIKKTDSFLKFFTKKFKRKKSPQRRVRIRKSRGPIKKRTLNDSLKREFKNLRRYNLPLENGKTRAVALSFTGEPFLEKLVNNEMFTPSPLQRRAKQKKQRFWKQKRSKYSQKLRKYRKRRRSVLGKIRILNKQLKRIQSTNQLKNWWWKTFLPNLRATTDSLWQYEKDRQIQQKLLELSTPEILERDNLSSGELKEFNSLQIGDFDYKPLAIPEAVRIGELRLNQKKIGDQPILGDLKNREKTKNSKNIDTQPDTVARVSETSLLSGRNALYINQNNSTFKEKTNQTTQMVLTSPIPFYAGWDESLRKFVVTNRLLSRRESGYEIPLQGQNLWTKSPNDLSNFVNSLDTHQNRKSQSLNELSPLKNLVYSAAPLKGMNTATTLYWQIPFTTYDPDQFFALGLDGFAPLGWRRFQFRHSILKSWLYEKSTPTDLRIEPGQKVLQSKNPYVIKNKTQIRPNVASSLSNQISGSNRLSQSFFVGNKLNSIKQRVTLINRNNGTKPNFNKDTRNIYRRVKKRYRRVKKHPRSPVWFPSGPLLNQVLPVHYIYIFYKRSRLPRDRYIKRRLLKSNEDLMKKGLGVTPINNKNLIINSLQTNQMNGGAGSFTDFTLRKRIKTKRKYHLKQDLTKQLSIIPRRVKFIGDAVDTQSGTSIQSATNISRFVWRPLSRQKFNKSIGDLIKEKRALRSKQRKKELQDLNNKQPTNIRIKQLRRRVQRQIIRSVWRYKPRAGGFVWPGDYLKLELIKAPKLNVFSKDGTSSFKNEASVINSTLPDSSLRSGPMLLKRKKKRSIQDWQIPPKKYLLQKHNYNVLKKKLEKAQRTDKIPQRKKDLSMLL